MFARRSNRPGGTGRRAVLTALVLLVVVVGVSVALAPRMSRLVATEEQVQERTGEDTIREASAEKDGVEEEWGAAGTRETTRDDLAGDPREEGGGSAEQSPEGSEGKQDSGKPERAGAKDEELAQKPVQERREERAGKSRPQQQVEEEATPPAPSDPTMSLTIPRLDRVQGDTVLNSGSPQALDRAAIKLPSTGFPWQEGWTNTYIAGHRIGWPGTETRYQFYNMPAMQQGNAVFLTDANGTTYEYRVTKKFAVYPDENWVTEPVAGKDMVTLQTCVDSPDPSTWWDITPRLMNAGPESGRLIVRAEKVATYRS